MLRLLKYTWFPVALAALAIVFAAVKLNEPFGWFVAGCNTGLAISAVMFVLSRYGRTRFPS